MVSDEERREVAGRMRAVEASEFKDSPIVPFLDCLGVGYTNWRGVMGRLAELVDRPTTGLSVDEDGRTCCASCGCSCLYMGSATYCPDCGAEVVRDGRQ